MKRFLVIALCAILLLWSVNWAVAKEKPHRYSSDFSWEVFLDTTSAVMHDTSLGAFHFTQLGAYTKVVGYIFLEYVTHDSGDAAADIIDTTKDSVIYVVKTYCAGNTSISRTLEIDSLAQGGGGSGAYDTVWFSIAGTGDSAICDYIDIDLVVAIADSDNSVARAEAGLTYKATVNIVAK